MPGSVTRAAGQPATLDQPAIARPSLLAIGSSSTAARTGRRSFSARHPAWPLTALLIGYPIWWALGLADFTWIFLAVPMISQMVAWHVRGERRLRLPPGFGIWLLFLIVVAAGIAAISLTAPGTVASPVSHRVISYANRGADYLGVTVLLLYAGNLTEKELSRHKFAWMLGLVGLYTIAGGLAGMVMPHLHFNSPLLHLLPHSVRLNSYIQASMQPGLSQVQNVLGTAAGRPKAPFDYTNIWGDCLTSLVPYLLVGWWNGWFGWPGRFGQRLSLRQQRLAVLAAVGIAAIPLLYSLNRGAWIGAGLSVGYLAFRFALKGRTALLAGLAAIIAIGALLFVVTPLGGVVTSRLHHGKSNNLRANLASLSVTDGLASPIIGYGDTRQEQGSASSIAIGPSLKCPSCGQLEVGSTGQLWLLLICDGFLGTALYLGFFCYGIWYFRHDQSPEAVAGVLVILLSFVYMFTYDAAGAPIGFTMLAIALMWKNSMYRRQLAAAAAS
jgi:hypothetical protein